VKLQTYVALHVKPPFFFSILPKSECVENDSKSPKHFPPPENSPGGSKAVMCWQTDREDEANSHISQLFCEHALKRAQ